MTIVTPGNKRSVLPECKAVIIPHGYGSEVVPLRNGKLTILIAPPRDQRAVCPQGKTAPAAGSYCGKIVAFRHCDLPVLIVAPANNSTIYPVYFGLIILISLVLFNL